MTIECIEVSKEYIKESINVSLIQKLLVRNPARRIRNYFIIYPVWFAASILCMIWVIKMMVIDGSMILGISLGCLLLVDLIMARVAKVKNGNTKNFKKRMIEAIKETKQYSESVLPEAIKNSIAPLIRNNEYNATLRTACYVEGDKNELNAKYIDVFLDVLGLYCGTRDLDPEKIRLEDMKKNHILSLSPEDINDNYMKVIQAIDRAMFFLQTRCGIRNINDINYSLVIVLLSVVFLEERYFYSEKTHDLLEAWYWCTLFSGWFDKDQNANMMSDLKNVLHVIRKDEGYNAADWLKENKKRILDMPGFSEKKLLLMELASDDRIPKRVLRDYICEFLLSKTYSDMFDSNKRISVFCKDAAELEAHHIIPLGTVKTYGQSTRELRNNGNHICNSPLNFVYITKSANKKISDDPLDTYIHTITPEARTKLFLTAFQNKDSSATDDKIHNLLENRFTHLQGEIKDRIGVLLSNWG